jgi:hypothetical protein
VIIKGENLGNATEVLFGGMPCQNFVIVDDQTITCSTPPHTAGNVAVVVKTATDGAWAIQDGFNYVANYPVPLPVLPPNTGLFKLGSFVVTTYDVFIAAALGLLMATVLFIVVDTPKKRSARAAARKKTANRSSSRPRIANKSSKSTRAKARRR